MIKNNILETIGQTPIVRLSRVLKQVPIHVFAKVEAHNPGGSIKDRPAMNIIKSNMEAGNITPDTVVIESSSGNLGVGLAQICAYYGLRFICVVDPKTPALTRSILEAYGAEIELVPAPDLVTGDFLQARLNRVDILRESIPNSFWPNQYASPYNPASHYQTMHEIATSLDGRVDYLFCATSTCGALRGCAEYIGKHHLKTEIIAVDAVGSVIFGHPRSKRLIPGHGAGIKPPLFSPGLASRYVHISDLECVVGCRKLLQQEAILAGGSSGAIIMSVEKLKDELKPDSSCVLLFPDRGDRYLETIYSDYWVKEHFGDITHLWKVARKAQPV
jgi:cysteine synthase A